MSKVFRLTILYCILICVTTIFAYAKRVPAPVVKPVIYQEIKFIAPNTPQTMGCVEAWDININEKVWEKQVYNVVIDPGMEADVQWVFITSLEIRNNELVVTNEDGEKFTVDISDVVRQN